jgi:hypothetical protein
VPFGVPRRPASRRLQFLSQCSCASTPPAFAVLTLRDANRHSRFADADVVGRARNRAPDGVRVFEYRLGTFTAATVLEAFARDRLLSVAVVRRAVRLGVARVAPSPPSLHGRGQ